MFDPSQSFLIFFFMIFSFGDIPRIHMVLVHKITLALSWSTFLLSGSYAFHTEGFTAEE